MIILLHVSIVVNCFYITLIHVYFLLHNLSTPIVLFLRLVFDQIVRQLEKKMKDKLRFCVHIFYNLIATEYMSQ